MRDSIVDFTRYYNKQFRQVHLEPVSHKRLSELHPSSFPFCALRTWYSWACEGEIAETSEMEAMGIYYTRIGTIFHSVAQKVLGRGNRILGDWTCPNCKHVEKFSTESTCPKCESVMDYEELGVYFGKHIVGHCDGLFKVDGGYIVIDYKTTSILNITRNRKKRIFPYKSNVSQIESYCYLLAKQYKINILGWILVYCSRDNPVKNKVITGRSLSKEDKIRISSRVHLYDRHYGIILRASTLKDLSVVVREKPCKAFEDLEHIETVYSECPLRDVCFDRNLLREALLEAKDCGVHLPLIDSLKLTDERRKQLQD